MNLDKINKKIVKSGSADLQTTVVDKLILGFDTGKNISRIDFLDNNLKLINFEYLKDAEKELKNKCELLYKDDTVAEMYFNYDKGIGSNGIIIFKNSCFYTSFNNFFIEFIKSSALGFWNVNLIQLDIALDINNIKLMKEMRSNYNKIANNKLYLKNGTKIREYNCDANSYYIGNKDYINIYNKLKQNKKAYIQRFYLENGFDLDKGVTRIEMRLHKKTNKFFGNILNAVELEKLINVSYINNIAKDIYFKKLQVKSYDNKNRSRRTEKQLISVDFTKNKQVIKYTSNTKNRLPSIRSNKIFLKRLVFEWYKQTDADVDSDFYKHIEKAVKNYNLEDWYINFITGPKFKNDLDDFLDTDYSLELLN